MMMGSLKELQGFLTERNIKTIPWGKKGLENVRDLEFYQPKTTKQPSTKLKQKSTKPKPLSKAVRYYQKKEKFEKRVSGKLGKENLNIRYICLVYFPKEPGIIKSHLFGKKHQKKWKIYQARKVKQIAP